MIQFESRAVARLRERLGAAEEANQDLIAFARGHSGAVASIHSAALAAIEAADVEGLLGVVTGEWPAILGIDSAAVALVVGDRGFRAGAEGIQQVERAWVGQLLRDRALVEVRPVGMGHPLFGREIAAEIRAEALVRIDSPAPYPCGLLALGQKAALELSSSHGSELLLFLAEIVAAALRRFVSAS